MDWRVSEREIRVEQHQPLMDKGRCRGFEMMIRSLVWDKCSFRGQSDVTWRRWAGHWFYESGVQGRDVARDRNLGLSACR